MLPEPAPSLPDPDLFGPAPEIISPTPSTALVYGGEVIAERGEMLSLTDMWTAARQKHVEEGGKATDFDNRRPDDWKKDAANRAFLDQVARTLNTRPEGIWIGKRGVGGGTFAHWQVALGYAKWVSPEFHMWCNTVVRAHMEGVAGPAPVVVPLVTSNIRSVIADFRALFGVAKLMGLDKNQCAIRANRATIEDHGVDIMGKLGNPLLAAPHQDLEMIVGDLGEELGGLTARATNEALVVYGFQVRLRDAKNVIHYEATDLGRPHSRMKDVDIQKPGTSKQYLVWLTSVIEPLKAAMAKAADAA